MMINEVYLNKMGKIYNGDSLSLSFYVEQSSKMAEDVQPPGITKEKTFKCHPMQK